MTLQEWAAWAQIVGTLCSIITTATVLIALVKWWQKENRIRRQQKERNNPEVQEQVGRIDAEAREQLDD